MEAEGIGYIIGYLGGLILFAWLIIFIWAKITKKKVIRKKVIITALIIYIFLRIGNGLSAFG